MTSQPSSVTEKPASSQSPSKEGKGRYVQEKMMLALALIFFGGVLALTFIPTPFNGPAMGGIVFLTIFVMYRFG